MLSTLTLVVLATAKIFGPGGFGYRDSLSGYDGRWPGRRRRFVQDYHVPPHPVLTEYAEDMVGLERLHMKNMDKWPPESLRGGSGFDKLHFLKAFDIKFGKTVYRVTKYLGGGSFGRVFLATAQVRKKNLRWYSRWLKRAGGFRPKGESVAIKFLPNSNMPEVIPGTLARRERAKFVGQTLFWTTDQNVWSHPMAPPNPFVVMETAEMGEVRNYQANSLCEGPKFFREEVVRRIFSQLLQAVAFLHQNRFLHLDIKLENVLINIRGDVKLIDFGCSKQMEQGAVPSRSILTTDSYASNESPNPSERKKPEAALDQGSLDTLGSSRGSDLSLKTEATGSRAASVVSSDTIASNISNASRSAYAALIKPALTQTCRPIEMSYDEAENCGSKCIRAPELTPSYDDDRQARCDMRSDLWSCGVCLLSMLQGTYDLVSQEVKDNVLIDGQYHLYLSDWENVLDVLSCYGEGGAVVSDDAQDLLAGLLQPDPEFRFQTARDVLNHKWLEMKVADDDMLASMMVANNADQVEKGLALIPEGTAEQVLPFYMSLDRELKNRKKMLEKMRGSSNQKLDAVSKDSENRKKTYSPHRRPNQRRLSQLPGARSMLRNSTTSPNNSPVPSSSLSETGGITKIFGKDSQLTQSVRPHHSGSAGQRDPLARGGKRKPNKRSPPHGKLMAKASSSLSTSVLDSGDTRVKRHRSSTVSMTNSESLLGPFSETALARFQRDHLKFPKHWKGPVEWLFQFRRITHPAQVNPTLLKQAIRDVDPGIKDSALANRLKWFKKRLSEYVVVPLRFPELRMSMRQFSSSRTPSGNRTPSGGGTPTIRNSVTFGDRSNKNRMSFGSLRTGSGPARARRARRNRITYSDMLPPPSQQTTTPASNLMPMPSAAQSFSRVKGLRQRRQSFSLGASARAFQRLNPRPLTAKANSSNLHTGSDENDSSGVKFPGSIGRMQSRTSSLWIQVRTVEDGMRWTDEQLDYLKNDFGISNEWNSQDPGQPSSFSIDGQRLSDLGHALGLGEHPIDTLLERSKKAVAADAAAAHAKAAADAQASVASHLLERQPTLSVPPLVPLHVHVPVDGGVPLLPSPVSSSFLSSKPAAESFEGAFSAAKLATSPDLEHNLGVVGNGATPVSAPLRSVTETSTNPSVVSTTPSGMTSMVSTPSAGATPDNRNNAASALVLTPVMNSRIYIEQRETEELQLSLLKEQQTARENLVARKVLENFSKSALSKLDSFSLANLAVVDQKALTTDLSEAQEDATKGNDPIIKRNDPIIRSDEQPLLQYDPVLLANGGLTWFKDFNPDVQAQIYALFTVYRFAPGQLICKRGEWAHGMHVIVRGGAYLRDDSVNMSRNSASTTTFGEETGKWFQPHEMINAEILEGTVAAAVSERTNSRAQSGRTGGEGGDEEDDEKSVSLKNARANDAASIAMLEVGHILSQVTIVAAEEDSYDSDSTSDEDDVRSVVMSASEGKSGGCTTMYLDAKRVRDVLVRAVESGTLLGSAK